MSDAKILSEVPISMPELKEELEKIKKRDKELNFRANKAFEYMNQFSMPANNKEMAQEIAKLDIPRLKEQHIKKIVDVMPKTADELKSVLQGYPISINNENIKKIVDVIVKYVK